MVPVYVWITVTLFLAVYILYVVQRMIMNAQAMARQAKLDKQLKWFKNIFSGAILKSLNDHLNDLLKDLKSKENTTSEEDKEDDSDDVDLDDLLD